MGFFSWLTQELTQQQERGCPNSSEASSFREDYSKHVESEKRALLERQARERAERSSRSDR